MCCHVRALRRHGRNEQQKDTHDTHKEAYQAIKIKATIPRILCTRGVTAEPQKICLFDWPALSVPVHDYFSASGATAKLVLHFFGMLLHLLS